MAGMQKLKDEIAGYEAAIKGKTRADEYNKNDAASEISEEGYKTIAHVGSGHASELFSG